MLRPRSSCIVSALLQVGAGLVMCIDLSRAACVQVPIEQAVIDHVVATKDLESLMKAAGISIPSLYPISVNGVALEVAELRIAQPLAQQLVQGLQRQALIDGGWKASVGGGERVVLSRWAGGRHEALSLRRSGLAHECLANYSRQDLRQPLAPTASPPLRLPRGFSLMSVTEEKTTHRVIRMFTFKFSGSLQQARQRWVAALQADQWTLELENIEHKKSQKRSRGLPPVFATRGAQQMQAAVVADADSVRLVTQVSGPR